MLFKDIWQWSELTGFGDLPSPRDFAAASSIGNRKIVMYGGWDGKKWLSDVYVLDTISLEWTELSVSATLPQPRCGHTATMVEKRLLVYGGRGGGGPIMGDLWALKGLIEEENETPGWTQLKLPGQAPSPRCGHSVTNAGHYLLMFGGHGTGGWLSRYDIYYNDCVVLDRVSATWKRLSVGNEPPPARAYHSMTAIGSRYLLIGGFDGKSTYGEPWWLVPQDDPIANRLTASPPRNISESKDAASLNGNFQPQFQENQVEKFPLSELQRRLQLSVSQSNSMLPIVNELEDKELLELASRLAGQNVSANSLVK